MATTNKIRKRPVRRPSTRLLSHVEQAYVTELASLHKKVGSNTYQQYLHDVGPNGTPKWTLKRKCSLTAQNLEHYNRITDTSPTAVDFLSPTGRTKWSDISLSDLLAPPGRQHMGNFGVLKNKAYKRARAGLLKSKWSPWDYVSNGNPPNTVESTKEKEWWKTHNEPYQEKDSYGNVTSKGWQREWHYYIDSNSWLHQPKMIEPPPGYLPPAWKHRWVVQNTTKKQLDLGPRDEHAAQSLLLAVNNKPIPRSTCTAKKDLIPISDSTGLSFIRWQTTATTATTTSQPNLPREPIPDETGLSFTGWKKTE